MIKIKQINFRINAQLALQKIQDKCKRNEKNDTSTTCYKPLLIQNSQNYRKNQRRSAIISKFSQSIRTATQQSSKSNQFSIYNQKYHVIFKKTKLPVNRSYSLKNSRQNIQMSKTLINLNNIYNIINKKTNNAYISLQKKYPISISNKKNNELQCNKYYYQNDQKIQFIKKLYNSKTQDLLIQPNNKQQTIFICKLKQHINKQSFIAIQCDFGYNSLLTIISYIKNQNQLIQLILDKNPFTDQGVCKLIQIIPKLEKLKQLSLASVCMTYKSSKMLFLTIAGHPNLQIFNVATQDGVNRNRINSEGYSTIKEVLTHPLCKLSAINLSNTDMGQIGFLRFCQAFQSNKVVTNFKIIKLSQNQISISQQNISIIRTSLGNLSVQKLQLQNNLISDNGVKILSYVLGIQYGRNIISTRLQYLDISNNHIQSQNFQSLCSTLGNNKKLSNLYLNKNNLSDYDMFHFVKYIVANSYSIKILQLRNTLYCSSDSASQHIKSLAQGLLYNKSLKQLDISGNIFNVKGFIQLFKSLQQNHVLKVIKIQKCGIDDQCLQKAQKYIKLNQVLYSINLSNNFINDRGGHILLNIITENHRIGELNVKKNCINNRILLSIQNQIKQNKVTSGLSINNDPQYKYIQYAQKMQNQQKNKLIKQMDQLKFKNNMMMGRSLMIDIAERDDTIKKKQKQLMQQNRMIQKLQKQLQKASKRQKKGMSVDVLKSLIPKQKQHQHTFLITS